MTAKDFAMLLSCAIQKMYGIQTTKGTIIETAERTRHIERFEKELFIK